MHEERKGPRRGSAPTGGLKVSGKETRPTSCPLRFSLCCYVLHKSVICLLLETTRKEETQGAYKEMVSRMGMSTVHGTSDEWGGLRFDGEPGSRKAAWTGQVGSTHKKQCHPVQRLLPRSRLPRCLLRCLGLDETGCFSPLSPVCLSCQGG